MYKLREERDISPKVFSNMVASLLYQKRFGPYFIEPLIAGLDDNNEPFISGMDLIGAPVFAKDFVLAGTADEAMFGMSCQLYFSWVKEWQSLSGDLTWILNNSSKLFPKR
jgi:20S proteasome subunit beta 3